MNGPASLFTKFPFFASAAAAALLLSSCTPIGMATGAGAGLGIASAQEGGLKGAVSDLTIKAKISDLWFRYDLNTFTKLNITVDQGRVLLTGAVQNAEHRVEAVRLAWQVEGVKQVINEIKVADGEGLPGYLSDKWITTRLRTGMTFDPDIQSINYSVDTVQGVIYLMGVANSQQELDLVMQRARTIPNVRQVVSYVKMAGENVTTPEPGAPVPQDTTSPAMPPMDMSSPSYPPADPYYPPQPGGVGAPVQVMPAAPAGGSHSGIQSEVLPPP